MKLNDMRAIVNSLNHLDGDVEVISHLTIERDREGGYNSIDSNFTIEVQSAGECTLICDHWYNYKTDVWSSSDGGTLITNKDTIVMIKSAGLEMATYD